MQKKFIEAAADNIYRNLRYYNGRGKDVAEYLRDVDSLRKQIGKTKTIEELMGFEGNIRRRYYAAWNVIVNQEIKFEKRVMHPPDNMINSLISFVNTLIYTKVLSEIYHTQLNPTISYLHEPGVRRYSLCLDISEVFKPDFNCFNFAIQYGNQNDSNPSDINNTLVKLKGILGNSIGVIELNQELDIETVTDIYNQYFMEGGL